jgi:hypothetical protein
VSVAPVCGACAHFRNDPAFLEAAFAGLRSMGSGWASVSGGDGLCVRHDRHVGAKGRCPAYQPLAATITAAG